MTAPVSRVPLAVVGASGRMGLAVVRGAEAAGFRVVCAVASHLAGADVGELAGLGKLGVLVAPELSAIAPSGARVVIDFSHASALPPLCDACVSSGAALVSGTTGLDGAGEAALERAAAHVPVLWEPNMSVGVAVLAAVVRQAIALLGASVDVEIVETHHSRKADAPSGTALRLAEVVSSARAELGAESRLVHGREGRAATRAPGEVGLHAVRGGDVIGDHTVHLFGAGERLELTHRATSRELFAQGALRAAARLVGRGPGRVRLAEVLEGGLE